ncbi:ribokinase [Maribellus sp. YY47]|uniref:ribokinase n=1 Tax=Maribellus sp. YY47 TaxID=2929486 RepID=UPI002001360D|nr:ribokinase [Maribellus sp. YY47]MCK3684372.1 ribokinase [Maribellus sp. YY47]
MGSFPHFFLRLFSNPVLLSLPTHLIARLERFPVAGETIEGNHFLQAMGGKGANQALAAYKLGGDVKFITSLGKDVNGENTLKYYRREGLDVEASLIVEDTPSGTAMIWVDAEGENCIVITPGANKKLSPKYILENKDEIISADILLLQMEIPYQTVKTICDIAYRAGKKVILNVAPACKIEAEVLQKVDVLVVNETEAEVISGTTIDKMGMEGVVDRLLSLGVKSVVLTLGKKGCIMKGQDQQFVVPAFSVKAVDTTAAGDTFCAALAAELGRGHDWEQALRFASAASAICVTRLGAQPSIPSVEDVFAFLQKQEVNQGDN